MTQKNIEQIRHEAIDKLADMGVWIARASSFEVVCLQIEKMTGKARKPGQKFTDYMLIFLEANKGLPPPYRPPFRPLSLKPHPRLDDINRAQPRLITPKGVGNDHATVFSRAA